MVHPPTELHFTDQRKLSDKEMQRWASTKYEGLKASEQESDIVYYKKVAKLGRVAVYMMKRKYQVKTLPSKSIVVRQRQERSALMMT